MTIENTSEKLTQNPRKLINDLVASHNAGKTTGDFIESMEADGQRQFVASTKLPTDMGGDEYLLREWGVKFGPVDEKDELFTEATLPPGWIRKPTDHDMWSSILDDRGIERAMVFYKAAPYDRRAHLTVVDNVGRKILERVLLDGYEVPWEVLTPREGSELIAAMIEREHEEDPPYDKHRYEREQARVAQLWSEAAARAGDRLEAWRSVLED